MKTIIFDLDGALSESKEAIDDEIANLISKLLCSHNVAIISSSMWRNFQKQVVVKLNADDPNLSNLYLLPTSGGSLYQTWGKYGWVATYQLKLLHKDIVRITKAISEVMQEKNIEKPKTWGRQLECKESKIIFSVLGQNAPSDEKDKFDPDSSKRKILIEALQKKISSYDIRCSGKTSIEISLRGINKKYGIDELMKRLHVSKDDVVYIGPSIFKGGEGYVAIEMGLEYVQVNGVEDTKGFIRNLIGSKA